MKVKHTFLTLLLFLFCFNFNGFAQLTSEEVDSLVTHALETFNVAGAAVAIVKDGNIIYKKGFGVKSAKTGSRVNEHTNFAIASNSKAFTTTALAILVEEGKLSWTDRVKDYIPEFTMYNPYVAENFNIQDLLTHRSGLGLGMGDLMFFPDGSDFTIDDLLRNFQYFKPVSAFRTQFDYDNLLYLVAGEVIARVSGMTWEEFIKERILDPLDMDNTYPSLAYMKDKSNLASPHNADTGILNVLPDYEEMINGAAAGIYSNVDNISHWMLLHLNKGKYGDNLDKQLFSEDSQHEMWKIHTTLNTSRNPRYNSHFAGYGLGWFLTDVRGNMEVSHTGGLPGMLSRTVMIPDLNLGVVVLTNTEPGGGPLFASVSRAIVDSYLGLDNYQWVDKLSKSLETRMGQGDEVTKQVWEQVEAAKTININHDNYLGVYSDNWFGKVEVFMKGDQLWITSYRSPKLNGAMYYYNANTFAIKWEYQDMNCDAFAMFTLDEHGKGSGMIMKGISPNIDFSFDFHDLEFKRVEE